MEHGLTLTLGSTRVLDQMIRVLTVRMSHGTWSNPNRNPRINKGTGSNDQSINRVNVTWNMV